MLNLYAAEKLRTKGRKTHRTGDGKGEVSYLVFVN